MANNDIPTINIRMYNVGFGDCFLIRYNDSLGSERKILVDCGVHTSGQAGKISDTVKQIISDVADAKGKSVIDVVICTHRHQDHISGFALRDWDTVEVKEVWMPWTENPQDEEARRIRDTQTKKAKRQYRRLGYLKSHFAANPSKHAMISSLLQVAINALSNDAAMKTLHEGFSGNPSRRFLPQRGSKLKPFTTKALPDAEIHVLGPSFDEAIIRDMNPPEDEHYLWFDLNADGARLSEECLESFGSYESSDDRPNEESFGSYESADEEMDAGPKLVDPENPGLNQRDLVCPFESWVQTEAEMSPNSHLILTQAYREKISDVLMEGFEYSLASLASSVNGTSLMLVIRIGKHYLLLPGDAQWGTWNAALSDPESRKLLEKTTLLKVSHHGSENATPTSLLEGVLSSDCVSMVSTREGTLDWRIPLPKLVTSLRNNLSCLIRSDKLDTPDPPAVKDAIKNLSILLSPNNPGPNFLVI